MTTELSKYKDRDGLQMNELIELRQSTALLERVCIFCLSHSKIYLNFFRKNLVFKWKLIHYVVDFPKKKQLIKNYKNNYLLKNLKVLKLRLISIIIVMKSFEVLSFSIFLTILFHSIFFSNKDLEKKLDAERLALKRSSDDLTEAQQKVRILEMDLKQMTINHNQLNHDYQLAKQSIKQMEFDNQRRTQYDKDLKQLQEQLQNSSNKEKQILNDINQYQNENERLSKELRQINNEYQIIKSKIIDYEEQVEGLNNNNLF